MKYLCYLCFSLILMISLTACNSRGDSCSNDNDCIGTVRLSCSDSICRLACSLAVGANSCPSGTTCRNDTEGRLLCL